MPSVSDLDWKSHDAGLTKGLAKWAYELDYNSVPEDAKSFLKVALRDFVVISLAGASGKGVGSSSSTGLNPIVEIAKASPGTCSVIGTTISSQPLFAAMANGAFAHSLNLMDVHRYSAPTHLGPTVFSASLALAEELDLAYEEFALIAVVGFEAIGKLGMALNVGSGVVDSTDANGIGASLIGAKAFQLDEKGFSDCLGIGAYLTSGGTVSLELTSPGYWCRPMLSGWQASIGIMAATMAKLGLRGSSRILEAPFGFLNACSLDPDPAPLTHLGNPYEVTRLGLKPYPTTRYLHSEIEALLNIVVKNNIETAALREIIIEKPRAMHLVTGTLERITPEAPEVARLSSHYFAAVVCKYRSAWLDALEADVFKDPEIRTIIDLVSCRHAKDLDAKFPEGLPARVTVITTDGRSISEEILYPKGEPERPLTESELTDKHESLYDYCISNYMDRDQFDEILEMTQPDRLQGLKSMRELGDILQSTKEFPHT